MRHQHTFGDSEPTVASIVAANIPHPTGEPWMPWLRDGGLMDGDKVLIGLSPDMAQAILYMDTNDRGGYELSEDGRIALDKLTSLASFLRAVGAEDA